MIKFTYRFGDKMKKYFTILLCLLSVFFLFYGEVKAEDSITFSCDYKYGSGDSEIYIHVKVNDLSYEEFRNLPEIFI